MAKGSGATKTAREQGAMTPADVMREVRQDLRDTGRARDVAGLEQLRLTQMDQAQLLAAAEGRNPGANAPRTVRDEATGQRRPSDFADYIQSRRPGMSRADAEALSGRLRTFIGRRVAERRALAEGSVVGGRFEGALPPLRVPGSRGPAAQQPFSPGRAAPGTQVRPERTSGNTTGTRAVGRAFARFANRTGQNPNRGRQLIGSNARENTRRSRPARQGPERTTPRRRPRPTPGAAAPAPAPAPTA